MFYKVKEVADLVGVSVRTLHHYDQIDILKPESTTESGYRLYSDKDIELLQQILFFKELDFSLQEIKKIINSPGFNRKEALLNHKVMLVQKKQRLERIIESVEKSINSIEGVDIMSKEDMFNCFDISQIEEHKKMYAKEVKEKYGNTDAYKESEAKTANYAKQDWARLSKQGNAIFQKLALLMDKEIENEEVQKVIGEWRQYITDNYYNCTPEIFRSLAKMYICDERFKSNIDKTKAGLSNFLSEAMEYYCTNLID